MSFVGFLFFVGIFLLLIGSCVYSITKLIKRWDEYKHSPFKLLGVIVFICVLLFFSISLLTKSLSSNAAIGIHTHTLSDLEFNIDRGVAEVDAETFFGESRGASIFGSGGYTHKWIILGNKTFIVNCYIMYYPVTNENKMKLTCTGDKPHYLIYFAEIYPDAEYANASSTFCSNCAKFKISDFTSRGYTLPDENNTRVDIVPR